jgi:hypothetical protein
MNLKKQMLCADGHFFIPAPPKQRRQENTDAVPYEAKSRTEFLVLTQTLRPALVTISVILAVGAVILLNF